MRLFASVLFTFGLFSTLMYAEAGGAAFGTTGAPGEITCVSCHSGTLNAGSGAVAITFPGGSSYTPGATVRMRVTVTDNAATRWGFSLTAKKEGSTISAGALAIPAIPATSVVRIVTAGANTSLTQTTAGTFGSQTAQAAWEFDWTAPAAGTGAVRFYAAAIAANNNNSESGDRTYTANLAVSEATGPTPAITPGNTILPQFVFGGGWTSWLYFSNNTTAQVAFTVRFYNDSAVEMPFGGGATREMIIPPLGTVLILTQNTGSLQQGWATFDLPPGVTGYGVLRQAIGGIPDQEAVVPFVSSSGRRASLTYDDSNLTTAVAIWYNGTLPADIAVSARDESGALIGTATISMTPGTKTAFLLRDRVPDAAGKRGLVEFSAPAGSIAVLGVRFAGSAFTSISPAP